MVEVLGVGIIGSGGIASTHASAYQNFDDVKIIAFADIFEEKARSQAERFGAPLWFKDYENLLKRDDIQIVSVCTPPFEHSSCTIASLQAGKHTLCEKPMATSLKEADAMIQASRESQRNLGIIFQWRFGYDMLKVHHLVTQGQLGPLILGKCATLWYRAPGYYDLWWRGTWEKEGGGVTLNHAIHAIDSFLWIMGEPENIFAWIGTYTHSIEVEDTSVAVVRFRNGALGEITSTVCAQSDVSRLEFFGEKAATGVPFHISAHDPNYKETLEKTLQTELPPPSLQGHPAQIRDFINSVKENRPPKITGEEGRRSLELVMGLYKSAITQQIVPFPISAEDPFYDKIQNVLGK